jgi:RES domain-containing protein
MADSTGRGVFRVCRARYARLDGAGARRAGGRWNSPGRAVVYMAESIAVAVLENLVHMRRQDFPRGYVCVAAVLPNGISTIHEKDLRKHRALQDLSTEQLGDWWIDSGMSAVLQVPSFVVAGEHNFLLNPVHPEFARIQVEPPAIFHFDPRLFEGS